MCTEESVDGSGNSKISKFFKVETEKIKQVHFLNSLRFSVLSPQEPIDKTGYPFSSFANKCNRSLVLPFFDFAEGVSFAEKLS